MCVCVCVCAREEKIHVQNIMPWCEYTKINTAQGCTFMHVYISAVHPRALNNEQSTAWSSYCTDRTLCSPLESAHPLWTFDPRCWAFRQYHICYYVISLWLIRRTRWYTLTLWPSQMRTDQDGRLKRQSSHKIDANRQTMKQRRKREERERGEECGWRRERADTCCHR